MPHSSGTRHGTGSMGPGHGPSQHGSAGPAKPFTADSPTRETVAYLENGDSVEQAYRAERRAERRDRKRLKEDREERAWDALDALVDDPKHPGHFSGIRETLNRLQGVPTPTIEIGKDNQTVVIIGGLPDDDLTPNAGSNSTPNPAPGPSPDME